MNLDFISFIKKRLNNLPFPIGKFVSFLPFGLRPGIGKAYSTRVKEIKAFDNLSESSKKEFIFNRMKFITHYAYDNIYFYKCFYKAKGFHPDSLIDFSDLTKIPIISKADLQKYSLNERINASILSSLENTGGSSGSPLELKIEPSSVAHEWAHMHNIWKVVGFTQSDLRIVFSGRSSVKNYVQYDSARHQLNVDIYSGWQHLADRLLDLFSYYNPTFLHGYPSAIFDFIFWLKSENHPLLPLLKEHIKGMMLGSEFPSPVHREKVEKLLNCSSVSWYGHTERCVLAYEAKEKKIYKPYQSYGYAESEKVDGEVKLIATSYYNFAHPLIRYNTEDGIEPVEKEGILDTFIINKGRDGDFIFDVSGNKIFITGLIFGRHHKLFDYCSSIQVFQSTPGDAVVLYVPKNGHVSEPATLFDGSNVEINFSFKKINKPYKTKNGKTPLLVRDI